MSDHGPARSALTSGVGWGVGEGVAAGEGVDVANRSGARDVDDSPGVTRSGDAEACDEGWLTVGSAVAADDGLATADGRALAVPLEPGDGFGAQAEAANSITSATSKLLVERLLYRMSRTLR